ncbi:MAG TPA: gamma-mobile-trio recombinase GmtY [Methylobacter sp.]|jgi:integrase
MDAVKLVAKVFRSNAGVYEEIPVLMTDQGIISSHMEYLLDHAHARSQSWMKLQITSLKLLLRYVSANINLFSSAQEMFKTFVQQLYSGTIGTDGNDPSMLYWLPRNTATANGIIASLAQYSDWLTSNYHIEPLNPMKQACSYEQILYWSAWNHRHNRAFLGHTWDKKKSIENSWFVRSVVAKKNSKQLGSVKYFPDKHFANLLFSGFTNYGHEHSKNLGERFNIRDILITLLLNGGGLRISEPFHLYLHDVTLDPLHTGRNIAYVRVYHPINGQAPNDWFDRDGKPYTVNRESYLKGKFGLIPRNKSTNRTYRAGWKVKKLDNEKSNFITVQWFPSIYGELFYVLWKLYLRQIRDVERNHPFAFISLSGSNLGKPLSISAYYQNHARAINKIGFYPSKDTGLSPHGHRHAYGQRLKNAKIDPVVRRNALHHSSLESQLVYCQPQIEEVSRILNNAEKKLGSETLSNADFDDLMSEGFKDVDPYELLSGQSWLLRS